MQQKTEEIKNIAMYQRGSDITVKRVFQRIYSERKGRLWTVSEMKDIASIGKIRRALKSLEDKGHLKKIRAYISFWERTQ